MPDLERIIELRNELKKELQKDADTALWMKHNGKGDRLLRVVDRYIKFITPLLQPKRKVTWKERNQLVRMIRKIENRWYAFDKETGKVGKLKHAKLAKALTEQFLEHFDILQCYEWESDPNYFLTFAQIEKLYERAKKIDALQLDSDEGSNLLDKIHPKHRKGIKGIAFDFSLSENGEKAGNTKKADLTISFSNNDSFSDILEDSETSFEEIGAIYNHKPKEDSFMDDPLLSELVEGMKNQQTVPLPPIPVNAHNQPIHLNITSLGHDKAKTTPILGRGENQIGQSSVNHGSAKHSGKA